MTRRSSGTCTEQKPVLSQSKGSISPSACTEQAPVVSLSNYRSKTISLEVKLDRDTVWLNQQQLADLYGTKRQAITKHIANIYECEELEKPSTSSILEQVRKEGNRMVTRKIEYYNLDMIISVGYRVNTKRGIQFRQWANRVLKDYLLRGYSVNRQLIALQERTDERFLHLQHQLDEQRDKVEFLVRIHRTDEQRLFPTGCVFDAWEHISALVRTATHSIILIPSIVIRYGSSS